MSYHLTMLYYHKQQTFSYLIIGILNFELLKYIIL